MCLTLLEELWALRKALLASEHRYAITIAQLGAHQQASARNLTHYLAFRATDLRALQEKLAWLGVSSLGRAESHVMANLDKVIGILHRLTGQSWLDHSQDEPAGSVTGARLLTTHAQDLLGPALPERRVRIMVTLGTEAATDFSWVRGLVDSGMDVARINCAHDDAPAGRPGRGFKRVKTVDWRQQHGHRFCELRRLHHSRSKLAQAACARQQD